jgi:hypothetical protein
MKLKAGTGDVTAIQCAPALLFFLSHASRTHPSGVRPRSLPGRPARPWEAPHSPRAAGPRSGKRRGVRARQAAPHTGRPRVPPATRARGLGTMASQLAPFCSPASHPRELPDSLLPSSFAGKLSRAPPASSPLRRSPKQRRRQVRGLFLLVEFLSLAHLLSRPPTPPVRFLALLNRRPPAIGAGTDHRPPRCH